MTKTVGSRRTAPLDDSYRFSILYAHIIYRDDFSFKSQYTYNIMYLCTYLIIIMTYSLSMETSHRDIYAYNGPKIICVCPHLYVSVYVSV